jgi:putative radical SAM enzyme (TIGR03279 family)
LAVKITGVDKGSPAQKAQLSGATLLSIDGNEINDMLDYEFYAAGAHLELAVVRDGVLQYCTVDKEEYQPLGCQFGSYLIDQKHSCKNKCMFCFIDQMPKGLRSSLYFKDDDERLSFLFGNYITLTNLSQREVERIKQMHISPINISVHTTEPELRVKMMRNPHAGEVLDYIRQFAEAGIEMNFQLVLCRGINDGDHLKKSIEDLAAFYPATRSIAAVPCGLTKYREGLAQLESYDAQSAGEVLDIIDAYGQQYQEKYGERIVYPGDELVLLAGRPIPPDAYYCGYPQLENGVGMWRSLHDEFMQALPDCKAPVLPRRIDIATGTLAAPLITMLCDTMHDMFPRVHVTVHAVKNEFFGGNVNVAGLVTGRDIIAQLKGKVRSRVLGIPEVMLREEKDKFLDDTTVRQVEQALHVKVRILPQDGAKLLQALMK